MINYISLFLFYYFMSKLNIGNNSADFDLLGVDNSKHSLSEFASKDVLVIMFTCNHCPVVQAYESRLVKIQDDYKQHNVELVAINSNDPKKYPEDSFEQMIIRSKEKSYNFNYLIDEDQIIADAYGAERTPEIFVFDNRRILRYHGRIDDNKDESLVQSHDLRNAIDCLISGTEIDTPETSSIGCSIKWI